MRIAGSSIGSAHKSRLAERQVNAPFTLSARMTLTLTLYVKAMTSGCRVGRLSIAALALFAPAGMAHAATVIQSNGQAVIIFPVTVTKLKDMDFGYMAVTAAGTAVLEPNADTYGTTGGVTPVGGSPQCAEFVGS